MKKGAINKYCLVSFYVMLFLFLILITPIPIYSVQQTTVSISPPSVTTAVGNNFTINVIISSVFDLYGWEFKLNWSAVLLDVVSVVEGPFLKSGGSTFFYTNINATAGRMVVDCTLLGFIPGVSGNGTLATITFHVKNVGECPLNLFDVLLINSFEQIIPCQTLGGYGCFSPAHDVAITHVSASPTLVLPGDFVNINVTVENQGGFNEVFNVTTYVNSKVIGEQIVSLSSGSSATIPFTWDTTGFEKGEYTISASATPVLGEVDTGDNNKAANDIVTILYPGHDVAVFGVKSFKTVIGQGYCANIDVTIKNYGVSTEPFEATTYANTTAIQTKTVTLLSGNKIELTVTWNTTGFSKGNYTISAYAWPVPDETETANNLFVDGWIIVAMIGDITGPDGWPDGKVDMRDVRSVAKLFGVSSPDPRYDSNCDITGPTPGVADGVIDMRDVRLVAKNFGKTDP